MTTTMACKFFVGGNFKMNPTSLGAAVVFVMNLTGSQLDPNTGTPSTDIMFYTNTITLTSVLIYLRICTRPQRLI